MTCSSGKGKEVGAGYCTPSSSSCGMKFWVFGSLLGELDDWDGGFDRVIVVQLEVHSQ